MIYCTTRSCRSVCLRALIWLGALACSTTSWAQTLTLGTGSGPKGGTISIPVGIDSGSSGLHPAALQWTLSYSPVDFTGVGVSAVGDAAASAGKSVNCAPGSAGTYKCVVAGITSNSILDGVVAVLTFNVAAATPNSTSLVTMSSAAGAAADGSSMPVSAATTNLGILNSVVQNLASLTCTPGTLSTPASAACTVTLTSPAPSGGVKVTLGSSSPSLTVPPFVQVAQSFTTASFSAAAAAVMNNTTATVTATANGTGKSTLLTLTALPVASSVACNPLTVTGGSSSLCTVALSIPARTGGTLVLLGGGSANVTVPHSVTVPSGATSTGFVVTTNSVTVAENRAITATSGGVQVSTSITVLSFVAIGGITCTPNRLTPPGPVSCLVQLTGPAPSGGVTVALNSTSPAATVPAALPIGAGSTSGIFGSNITPVFTDSTAVFSATLNGVTLSTTVNLLGPASLAPLSCNPGSFSSPGATTCTINLTHPAGASGMTVTVISTDPNVLVPTYLTVPAGASSTAFAATATKVTDTARSATLYAVAQGVSTNVQITLLPTPAMAGLRCTPTAVVTPGSTTCTVSVPDPAPIDGVRVSLTADNSAVSVPPQVLIRYGATTATFTATLNAVAIDTPANIEMPGAGPQPLMLLAPPAVSALTCDTAVLAGGGSTNCTVLLAKPVKGGGLDVLLSGSNTPALSVPASVNVPVGFNKASFKVVALAGAPIGPVAVTATTIVTSKSFVLSIRPHGTVTAVSCTPNILTGGGSTTCQANISPAAPQDGTTFTVSTGSSTIFVPPTVQVPPGAQSAQFTVTAPLIKTDETAAITVSLDTSILTQIQLVALKPVSVTCAPKVVASGSPVNCQVALNSSATDQVSLTLSSNNASVLVPASVNTQAGLTTLNFQATTRNVTGKQNVTLAASYQGVSASDQIQLMPAGPTIKAPSSITVIPGQAVAFNVDVTDPAGLAFSLTASGLPAGASFNPATGAFVWIPNESQLGTYSIQFKATNLALASSTSTVSIIVTTSTPTVEALVNPASFVAGQACSAGGVATLIGGGFTKESPATAATVPSPITLAGARVTVDGKAMPLLYVSAAQINFQCPNLPAGQSFDLVVEGALGKAKPFTTTMQYADPGIFSLDGTGKGQGAILLAGSSTLAMTPESGVPGAPAKPSGDLLIYATGLGPVGCVVPAGQPSPKDHPCPLDSKMEVFIGDVEAAVSFAGLAPGTTGLYQVNVQVPAHVAPGNSVPVRFVVHTPDGNTVSSNVVTIAVTAPPVN